MRPSRRVLALLLAVQIAGCGWKVIPPPLPQAPHPVRLVAERALLKVSGAAIAWGSSGLGETVRDVLVASGTFREVYYPIEPRNPPSLTLAMTARGTVEESEAIGTLKAVVIGLFLFLPVGLIRFDKTFHLDTDVVLRDRDRELGRFQISSDTEISFTMFSTMEDYEPAARKAAFKDLGEHIAAQLSTLPPITPPPS